MISISPRDYGSVEVYRPIIDGNEFLSEVAAIGDEVFQPKEVSSFNRMHIETDLEGPHLRSEEVPTMRSVVRVEDPNDLSFVMMGRSASPDRSSRYAFAHTAGRLAAQNLKAYGPVVRPDGSTVRRGKYILPGLIDELDSMIESDTTMNAKNIPLHLDAIVRLRQEPGESTVLGLRPRRSKSHDDRGIHLLDVQKDIIETRLETISRKVSQLPALPSNVIPFAAMPPSISRVNQDRFIDALNEQLPVRLVVDGLRVRSSS